MSENNFEMFRKSSSTFTIELIPSLVNLKISIFIRYEGKSNSEFPQTQRQLQRQRENIIFTPFELSNY